MPGAGAGESQGTRQPIFGHFETQEAANEAIAKVNGNVISGHVVYVGNFVKRDQRVKSMQWTNLYMKNVPFAWDEAKITEVCSQFGEISSVKVMFDDETSKSKGFGYVDFKEHESAKKCVDTMYGMEIECEEEEEEETAEAKAAEAKEDGSEEKAAEAATEEAPKAGEKKMVKKILYVARFMKKRERERIVSENKIREKAERIKSFIGKNLYVRNLSDAVTEEKLRQEFATYGTIKSCRVMKDEQGRSRGFGFVCMESGDQATKAL